MLTGTILHRSAKRHPEKIALICGERRITYSALSAAFQVNRMPVYAPDELVAIPENTGSKPIVAEAACQDRIAA